MGIIFFLLGAAAALGIYFAKNHSVPEPIITIGKKTGQAAVAYNSPDFISKIWQLEPGDVFSYDSNERKGYFNAP